jgi:chemotaxis signal transduction protein
MNEHGRHFGDSTDARASAGRSREEAPERREIILLSSGAHAFAVYAEEADGVTRDLKPTPLPGAPRAVAGVVCVRGRMRTVLDPLALLPAPEGAAGGGAEEAEPPMAAFIVTLRGDEQLALAVGRVEGIVELQADAPGDDSQQNAPGSPSVRGTLTHEGRPVTLLDPANIFEAAMRGTERRRQRLKDVNRQSSIVNS